MQQYTEVHFSPVDTNNSDILVALLSTNNYDQYLQEENSLKAYCLPQHFNEVYIKELSTQFNIPYTVTIIEGQNWNQNWEQNYEPVIVDNLVAVRANFHEPINTVAHNIIITPQMSFGTGHHATTYLMLQAIASLPCKGATVADYGCGTGVLGIYTSILGASQIYLCDIEEWCVSNTITNCELNNITNVQVSLGDLEVVSHQPHDIIVANINKNVLLKQMHQFKKLLKQNGHLLLSGFYVSDTAEIAAFAEKQGLNTHNSYNKMDWSLLHITN
jgi:ribosomal protein L11 methyltransferase